MRAFTLDHVTDHDLLEGLKKLVAQDRTTTAELVAHIAEVDARRLFAPAGYASMCDYCVHELRLSKDSALKRIQAARAARDFPVIFSVLAEGRVHLSGVVLLAPHLTAGNVNELIGAATWKTKAEIEALIARRFPKTEPLPMIEVIAQHAPGHVEMPPKTTFSTEPAPGHVKTNALRSRVEPISGASFALYFAIDQDAHEALCEVQDLLSHSIPSGDVAKIFAISIQELRTKLRKQKFAATDKPGARRRVTNPRTIPAHVRRAVWERDGGRCTFVSESGHHCDSTEVVEYDHIVPVARGGQSTVENVRLRCRTHNQLEAERIFGGGFMGEKRERSKPRPERKDSAARDADAAGPAAKVGISARCESEPDAALSEQMKDLTVCLRNLGFRVDQVRRAVEHCVTIPDATLEQHVRAALRMLCPKAPAPVATACAATLR